MSRFCALSKVRKYHRRSCEQKISAAFIRSPPRKISPLPGSDPGRSRLSAGQSIHEIASGAEHKTAAETEKRGPRQRAVYTRSIISMNSCAGRRNHGRSGLAEEPERETGVKAGVPSQRRPPSSTCRRREIKRRQLHISAAFEEYIFSQFASPSIYILFFDGLPAAYQAAAAG